MEPLNLVVYVTISIISIVVAYYILRWALSIDKQMKNQQIQIELLSKMSEKLGVSREEIVDITHRKY